MSRHVVRPQILVIADDFTGGNDAGVSLAMTGMTVNVAFTVPYSVDTDALVINSDSRALDAQQAAARVSDLALACQAEPQTQWLKKIDSTLRGNPGAELDALMRVTGKKTCHFSGCLSCRRPYHRARAMPDSRRSGNAYRICQRS